MHRRTGTAERPRPDSSAKRAPTTAGTGKPAPAIAAATPERRCAPCRRLAASLAVIGIAVLGQFIVVSARRRRRDFAVLKALGLLRRQVRSITAWQVSTVTGLAVLAGLPPGVAAGRWSWALFGHGLGIPAVALTPTWPVLLMAPAVILAANAVAFWPGRATARLRPADVLRAE